MEIVHFHTIGIHRTRKQAPKLVPDGARILVPDSYNLHLWPLAGPVEPSKTIQCMSSVYMYTTYSEPGRNLPGPVEWYKTLHCMSSVDRETRYIVAAICDPHE